MFRSVNLTYMPNENMLIRKKFQAQRTHTVSLLFDANYEAALRMADMMLDLYGSRHSIYLLRRQALLGLGRLTEAKASHKAALEAGVIGIPLAKRACELGDVAFAAGDMRSAVYYYNVGLIYSPFEIEMVLNVSAALLAMKDFVNAVSYAQCAMSVGFVFNSSKALVKKAIARRVAAHQGLHGHSAGIRPIWEAAALARVASMVACNALNKWQAQDDVPRMTSEVERYLAIHFAVSGGNWVISVFHYSAAIALSPIKDSSKLYADRVVCFLRMRKFGDGLRDAKIAVRLADKPDGNAHWLVGLCWHGMGRFENAGKAFAKAIAIDPLDKHVLSQKLLTEPNALFFDTVLGRLNVSMYDSQQQPA